MAKKETKEEKAMALTSNGIFSKFESVIPKGATTVNVLEAAATIIASSMAQMNANRRDLHNVMMHLEEYAAKRVALKDAKEEQEAKEAAN